MDHVLCHIRNRSVPNHPKQKNKWLKKDTSTSILNFLIYKLRFKVLSNLSPYKSFHRRPWGEGGG